MRKIGQGWQFNVYDAGAEVIKVRTSPAQVLFKLIRAYPGLSVRPRALRDKLRRVHATREEAVRSVVAMPPAWALMANLKITEDGIRQDKVTPLAEVLAAAPCGRRWIDAYIAFEQRCWALGFGDTSFNFTVNHGVDRSGHMVLMDFGEITVSRTELEGYVASRFWEKAWSFRNDLSPDLRAYARDEMARRLTVEALSRAWPREHREAVVRVDRAPVTHSTPTPFLTTPS